MKKTIFAMVLAFSSSAMGKTTRIINVFYEARTGEFAVNIEDQSGALGFIRTNKMILVSGDLEGCEGGCAASPERDTYASFAVVVEGQKVATVHTHDPDNLLSSKAFQITERSGREALVLNLDALKQAGRAEVQLLRPSSCDQSLHGS